MLTSEDRAEVQRALKRFGVTVEQQTRICPRCKHRPTVNGGASCHQCGVKSARKSRKHAQSRPWKPGGPGRPPIYREERSAA